MSAGPLETQRVTQKIVLCFLICWVNTFITSHSTTLAPGYTLPVRRIRLVYSSFAVQPIPAPPVAPDWSCERRALQQCVMQDFLALPRYKPGSASFAFSFLLFFSIKLCQLESRVLFPPVSCYSSLRGWSSISAARKNRQNHTPTPTFYPSVTPCPLS
jgi:hypothetical protein